MDPLIVDLLGSLARWGVTLFVGWLASHGVVASGTAPVLIVKLSNLLTSKIVLIPAMLAPLLWSAFQKLSARWHFDIARALPAGTSADQVKRVIAEGLTPADILAQQRAPEASKTQSGMGRNAGPSMLLVLVALLGAGVAASSCAPKTWAPPTQTLYNTDQVVKGLADLQHFAITLGEHGEISLQDAAFVIDGVQTVLDGVSQAGLGWGASVRASLKSLVGDAEAKPVIAPRLREPALTKLMPYVRAVLLLVDALEKPNPAARIAPSDPVLLAAWRATIGAERRVFYVRHPLRPLTR